MANKSSLKIASNIEDMRRKNNMGEFQKEMQEEVRATSVQDDRTVPAPVVEEPKKKKGRPKKGAALDLTVGINVFLDKPLHKKLQYARAETDISIKDLIYMATDYMMNECLTAPCRPRKGRGSSGNSRKRCSVQKISIFGTINTKIYLIPFFQDNKRKGGKHASLLFFSCIFAADSTA